ncbi:MAG TPA: hypothetical protein VHM30_15490 [Gemmatimonadaceae bacterium]|nr:hypothetical protein [Gemmatimonadaceae bacterium]
MLPDALDEYSRRFGECLFAVHPTWREHARPDPEAPGSLVVEVPSPVAHRALTIRTYGRQITVDFGPDGWHQHFGAEHGSDEGAYGAGLSFIEDLLAERVVITTRFLLGRALWMRARRVPVRRPRYGELRVYSWSGRLDQPSRG